MGTRTTHIQHAVLPRLPALATIPQIHRLSIPKIRLSLQYHSHAYIPSLSRPPTPPHASRQTLQSVTRFNRMDSKSITPLRRSSLPTASLINVIVQLRRAVTQAQRVLRNSILATDSDGTMASLASLVDWEMSSARRSHNGITGIHRQVLCSQLLN